VLFACFSKAPLIIKVLNNHIKDMKNKASSKQALDLMILQVSKTSYGEEKIMFSWIMMIIGEIHQSILSDDSFCIFHVIIVLHIHTQPDQGVPL